ncbi:MAG: YidC/Oxa1 family membrane protein insertase [Clostridiales bacterium]|nr:YidC/Oxa1 family membrane protein insertase [Clostridiales bacterium]
MSYIMLGLGWVLKLMYILVNNYGVAILLFTIIVKAILMPLTVKQQKSMLKTQKLQPLLMDLQKKYENDKDKLNQETMKLYQKYKINPMSGCLPMLIQLPILMALYWVVKQPIIYIMGVGSEDIWRLVWAMNDWAQQSQANLDSLNHLLESMKIDPNNFVGFFVDNNFKNFGQYEITIARFLHANPEIMNSSWITETGKVYRLIDFNFCGIDLSETPDLWSLIGLVMGKIPEGGITWNLIGLWLIPILAGASSYATSKITQAMQPPQPVQKDENGMEKPNTMKTMMVIMPLFSAWIAFSLPAAIGFYWILSSILQLLQQLVINKVADVGLTDEDVKEEMENAKKNRKKRKK